MEHKSETTLGLSKPDLLAIIRQRKEDLDRVSVDLKSYFVGLDGVIDRILRNIEVWYVIPELLTRPIIVNLWGMTGVGKTDLVRRLVKSLSFTDRFVEIQLTNKGSTSSSEFYSNSIQTILKYSDIDPNEPSVFLLDEIQRFRTIDEEGREIHDYKFQDVWTLLSDGRFGNEADQKASIISMIYDCAYDKDIEESEPEYSEDDEEYIDEEESSSRRRRRRKAATPEEKKQRKYHQTFYSAKALKRLLKLKESVEEIMTWDRAKKVERLTFALQSQSTFEGEDYSKMLIFVSGNLDEAYRMSGNCEEVDVDADLFHQHSQKINMLTIKQALKVRFRSEQIARFGNIHVIYPSLSRGSYEEIIRRRVLCIIEDVELKYGIIVDVDSTVNECIYRNGVFPVQGTRPLFSTISSFLENAIPFFILKAIEADQYRVGIFYKDKHICCEISGETHRLKYEGEIDRIKTKKDNDSRRVQVSVHEAGHAVIYAALFRMVPTQIAAHVASEDKNGFVGMHEFHRSRENIHHLVTVYMAGRAAEEIVFGDTYVGMGSKGDIAMATKVVANYIRDYGMDRFTSWIVPEGHGESDQANTNIDSTNEILDKFIGSQLSGARVLLIENSDFFKAISDRLLKDGTITDAGFQEIGARHGFDLEIASDEDLIYLHPYRQKYEAYCRNGQSAVKM